jgi:hypothetical protein
MTRLSRALRSIFSKPSEASLDLGANSARGGVSLPCAVTGLATILLIGFFAGACRKQSSGEQTGAQNIAQLRKQVAELSLRQQVLATELSLAQNPAPYLVVNLSNHSIALQARARTLRTFEVVEVEKRSVTGALNAAWTVKEKKPFEKSQRPKVLPGHGDEAAAEAAKKALWGPDRMPADYDLICEGDRTLEIRSLPSQQNSSRISSWSKSLYRRLVERYRRFKESRSAKNSVRIQLWLSENDAKLLFWSLPKQLEVLVVEGISLPEAPSAIPPITEAPSATPAKQDK